MPDERFVVDDVAEDVAAALASVKADTPEPAPVQESKPVETAAESAPVVDEPKTTGERERNADGTFKQKTIEQPVDTKLPIEQAKPVEVKPTEQAPVEAVRPPTSWSVPAKAAWDKLPPEVQQAIAKRETEVNNGFATLKDFQDLKPYAERARSQGQTLSQALGAYVGIDDLFRRDAGSGFVHVAQNLGLNQQQAGELFMRIATQLGAAPAPQAHQTAAEPGQATQNGLDPNAFQPLIAQAMQPLTQKLSTLEQQFTQQSQREQSLRQTAAEQAVEQFRADPKHRYYDDVESLVANLIQKGIVPRTGDLMADLSKAYDQACMLHPEVREALINERVTQTQAAQIASTKEAADKARLASRSVTGSPSSGAATRKPTQRAEGKSYDDDLNEDVAHAVRLVAARA
jgi:hypothetical protein